MPEAQVVPPRSGVKFGDLQIAFGHDTLFLSDLIAVFLIRDNLGKRPLFFAWSDGTFPDQTLGLSTNLLTQGLLRKLSPTTLEAKPPVVLNRGLGYVDLDRTRDLLFKVYKYEAATRARPRGWVDRPSQSILSLYSVIYGTVASSFQTSGDSALALRADSIAQAVDANARPEGLVAGDGDVER